MIRLEVTVGDIDNIMSQGYTLMRVYTDTSESGTFTTLDGTITLVAETSGYAYIDTDGSSSTWYKVSYYGAVPGESSKSDAQQGGTVDAYADAYEVRQELATGSGKAVISEKWDNTLWNMCVDASRLVDEYKGVEYGAYLASGSEARLVDGNGRCKLWLPWSAVSVSLVEVEETDGTYTTWTQDTDYFLYPYNSGPYWRLDVNPKSTSTKSVWTYGPRRVRVTGVWGISTSTPSIVVRAVKMQVGIWYNMVKTGWSNESASDTFGRKRYPTKLDPAVMDLVMRAPPNRARL